MVLKRRNAELLRIIWEQKDPQEILLATENLHGFINVFKKTLIDRNIPEVTIFLKNELVFISIILQDLRSSLTHRLTEQQNSLEQAKFEVEKDITGTIELEQVSELQKARLDQQIEQFEELQKLLVKI